MNRSTSRSGGSTEKDRGHPLFHVGEAEIRTAHDGGHARAIEEMDMALGGGEDAAASRSDLARERQAQRDPNIRAERAVAEWRKLEKEYGGLRGFEQDVARGQIEERLKTLAGAIKRDPQAESIMRTRSRELGIERGSRLEKVIEEKNLERALARSIERERDRGLER